MMLDTMLRDPNLPLPAAMVADGWRDTVVAVLTAPNKTAVAMVCSAKDPTGQAITFVQGGMHDQEVPFGSARREVREEIPSLKRKSRHEAFRVQWEQGLYLGSAAIRHTRSGVPKRLHFLVFPANRWSLVPNRKECTNAFWVHNPDSFKSMLAPTREQNLDKYDAMCAAAFAAQQHGYLL